MSQLEITIVLVACSMILFFALCGPDVGEVNHAIDSIETVRALLEATPEAPR